MGGGVRDEAHRCIEVYPVSEAMPKRGKAVARVIPEKTSRTARWDRSQVIDQIVKFSKTCRTRRKVNLQELVEEGRL